jgi:hypothetical protein
MAWGKASCHKRIPLLFFHRWNNQNELQRKSYAHPPDGTQSAACWKHHIVTMTFSSAVRGGQVPVCPPTGRSHAQRGRTAGMWGPTSALTFKLPQASKVASLVIVKGLKLKPSFVCSAVSRLCASARHFNTSVPMNCAPLLIELQRQH